MPKKSKKQKDSKLEQQVKKIPEKTVKKEQKKTIEVTIKKRIFGEAPEKYHFYLSDGRKLKSLFELIEAFENMSDDVFRHHANEHKNDFSSWIKDVFKEEDLANEIVRAESRMDAEIKLLKHIVKDLTAAKA
jgi:organic radical activating enzyme